MFLFLLLWIISTTVVFSFESILGIYWYEFTKSNINDIETIKTLIEKSDAHSNISFYWFLTVFSFLNGFMTGWVIELRVKILAKVNRHWQNTQPSFYRNTSGEFRALLPWLVVESPLFLIILTNILLIAFFKNYSNAFIWIIFFSCGFVLGQLVEAIKSYKTTISMDRPEKPLSATIQKVYPLFPLEYSLIIGQLYCKVLIPFFFILIVFLIPSFFLLIPYNDDFNKVLIILSILSGVILHWFYNTNDKFYFSKITIYNIFFVIIKNLLGILAIFSTLIITGNLYLSIIVSLMVGFLIPLHPQKLR